MASYQKNWPKFVVGFTACLLFRIFPFRPPNIEPIMAVTMPFGKAYGALSGFFFAFLSIVLYDLTTGTLGQWTLLTSVSYGIVGFCSTLYFKSRKPSAWNFAVFAAAGTVFFDAVTGLLTGPLFFNQPFFVALIGQIPFTALHLVGNVGFAFILSPAIYNSVVPKERQSPLPFVGVSDPKII